MGRCVFSCQCRMSCGSASGCRTCAIDRAVDEGKVSVRRRDGMIRNKLSHFGAVGSQTRISRRFGVMDEGVDTAHDVRFAPSSVSSKKRRRDHASGTAPGLHQCRQSRGSDAAGLPPAVSVALCHRCEWNMLWVTSHIGKSRAPTARYGSAMARRAAEWVEIQPPRGRHALAVQGGRAPGASARPVAAIARLLPHGQA